MTVAELKKKLEKCPDEMDVCIHDQSGGSELLAMEKVGCVSVADEKWGYFISPLSLKDPRFAIPECFDKMKRVFLVAAVDF